MSTSEHPFVQAAKLLVDTKTQVLDILKEYDMVSLGFKAKFDLMINQLGFLSGQRQDTEAVTTFEPVTEVMGEPVNRAQPIKKEELSPDETRKRAFQQKIDALQANLEKLETDRVLEAYQNDQIVLRGLAKRAGLENFRDGEINSQFIEDIRMGLKAQKELKEKKEAVEAGIPPADKDIKDLLK